MANKVKINDQGGVQVFPITHVSAVLDDYGNSVEQILGAQTDLINQKQLEVGAVPSDLTPTYGSSHWATSGGIFDAISSAAYMDEIVNSGDLELGTMNNSGGWTKVSSTSKVRSLFIPVESGQIYEINQGPDDGTQYYTIIDTKFTTTSDRSQSSIDYATGYTGRVEIAAGGSAVVVIPNDGHYLIVRADLTGGGSFAPTIIRKAAIKETVEKIDSSLVTKHYVSDSYFEHYSLSIENNVVSYQATANWSSKIIPVSNLVSVEITGTISSYSPHVPPVVFLRGPEPTQANWIAGAEMYGSEQTSSEYFTKLTTSAFNIPAEATHVLLQNINTISANSFIVVYDLDDIRTWMDMLKSRIKVVDINGNGDFASISDAVSGTSDGDTILVYPGTYDESVHMWGKNRHIVGVCRETCILTNGTGVYDTPPLEMNIGSIENMTIIADTYDSEITDPTTEEERTDYAVHVEYANGTPYECIIRNCTLVSKWNAAIGAGIRYNQTLIVENCDIRTECIQTWSSYQSVFKQMGAIFFHNDAAASNTQTGHFVLRNCRLRGVNNALSLSPQADRPYLEVEYINNNLCTTNNGVTNIIDNWHPSVTGRINKSVCCYGNNIAELNAQVEV